MTRCKNPRSSQTAKASSIAQVFNLLHRRCAIGKPLLIFIGCASLLQRIAAAEPAIDATQLPRVPPVEPANVLQTFQIKPGFQLDLVAAEPLVVDPIAMSFDENGRLFVVEMRDYSERRDERLGRIRLLIDNDGDGRFDKSTVYADGLPWPTAVICYGGGVFVGCTPDIFYFKDTNGDAVADEKRVVYTGFAQGGRDAIYGKERLNVQGLLNSFNWTLDNRIHGASGTMGGFVHRPGSANGIEVRGKDFSFDPRNLDDLRLETGGGQHGLSFDNSGRKFVCHNSSHIRLAMYEQHYASRNPYHIMPPALLDIPADGPSAEVFRISPEEPWRVIRTAWRVSGKVSGPIEGGGRSSGYFTSATGITIYRGNAFPADFLGDAFIADVGSNLIHRKKLYPKGASLIAKRPADEQKVEFIASRDLWFRPVQFANAPDGALYVADMYREVVEHPWSIPESIKKHLDLNSGNDRGRIYRIVPESFIQPRPPQLGKASPAELVAALAHPNGWHRDTATRLIYERQDKAAIPLLAKGTASALGRLHVLSALAGLNALTAEHLLKAFEDKDEAVRARAVRLCERLLAEPNGAAVRLRTKLTKLSDDPSIRVRQQLAFTLGELPAPAKLDSLAKIIHHDAGEKWIESAVLSSLREGAGSLFTLLAGKPVSNQAAMDKFLAELLTVVGTANDERDLPLAVQALEKMNQSVFPLANALASGMERARSSKANISTFVEKLTPRAMELAGDQRKADAERAPAITFLSHTTFSKSGQILLELLGANEASAVQLASLRALSRFSDASLAAQLIQRWSQYTPNVRAELLDILVARPERAINLLEAIKQRNIQISELSAAQTQALRAHSNEGVRESASRILAKPNAGLRDVIIEAFQPALALQGNAGRGKDLYLARCASCHRAGTNGNLVGPDMVSVKNAGKEKLLINILDPNREVPPQYVAYNLETKDGEALVGLISNEATSNVSIVQANGAAVSVLRSQIKSLNSQKQSLMPEGLEAGMSVEQMADLLEFVLTLR